MIWSSLIAQGKRRLLMSLLLAVLLSLFYLYLARFYQERVDSWLLGVGWALILLNLLRAGLGALYRWDRQPFERFDLGLEDDRARPGGAFRLEIVLRARRSLSLTRVAAQLRCIDEKVTTRGRVEKPLHEEINVISEGLSVSPGTSQHFEIELLVPPDAPTTFKDSQGRIRWTISLDAEVADYGVFHDEFEVAVAPA
jgi:hypothetical protein